MYQIINRAGAHQDLERHDEWTPFQIENVSEYDALLREIVDQVEDVGCEFRGTNVSTQHFFPEMRSTSTPKESEEVLKDLGRLLHESLEGVEMYFDTTSTENYPEMTIVANFGGGFTVTYNNTTPEGDLQLDDSLVPEVNKLLQNHGETFVKQGANPLLKNDNFQSAIQT